MSEQQRETGSRTKRAAKAVTQPSAPAGVTAAGAGAEPIGPSASSDRRAPPPSPPGSHPMGRRVGAYSGVITGGVVGTAVGGPVGGVVGAAVGAAAGSLAGKSVADKVDESRPELQSEDAGVDDVIRDEGRNRDL